MTTGIDVRLFTPDAWPLYKAIRLEALQTDPHVFGSTHAKESADPDSRWQEGLADPVKVAIFGVFDGDALIGMTGIALLRDDPAGETAKLWGSWIKPAARRRGASVPMYEARLDWARAHPTVRQVIVSHRQSNAASMRANQKHGFQYTHREDHTWPDGVREPHVFYALLLDK